MDKVVDQLGLLHLPRNRRQHLQVITRLLARDQHEDQVHALVVHRAVVPDANAAAADRQDVTAAHLDADVGQRDAQAEVGRHRALAGQQALEQRLALQVGKTLDADGQQFLQRAFEVDAPQVDDPAAGDDFIQPHGKGGSWRLGPALQPQLTSPIRGRPS